MPGRGLGAIALICALIGIAPALPPSAQEIKAPGARIYFSALNKEEKPVLGLKPSDFELRVNNKTVPFEDFRAGRDPSDRSIPLAAWILIGFGGPRVDSKIIDRQAGAAAAAFERLHPESVIGIKLISDRSETMSPLAHDPKALRGAFQRYSERRLELNVGLKKESAPLGEGGMLRAVELAMDELDEYVSASPALRGREIHRAIMLISATGINPYFKLKSLYSRAARDSTFLYPVFIPIATFGSWVEDYFDLAKKTAGVASVAGALRPGSKVLPLPRSNQRENALDVNFTHLIRDINGKYSFVIQLPTDGREMRLEVKCKVKGIEIRLPRTVFP